MGRHDHKGYNILVSKDLVSAVFRQSDSKNSNISIEYKLQNR